MASTGPVDGRSPSRERRNHPSIPDSHGVGNAKIHESAGNGTVLDSLLMKPTTHGRHPDGIDVRATSGRCGTNNRRSRSLSAPKGGSLSARCFRAFFMESIVFVHCDTKPETRRDDGVAPVRKASFRLRATPVEDRPPSRLLPVFPAPWRRAKRRSELESWCTATDRRRQRGENRNRHELFLLTVSRHLL